MHALVLALCLVAQADPFKTIADPARRANADERKAACEAFKAQASSNTTHYVAARFLEKSDREWKLVYDRLKTSGGTVTGWVEGSTFVSFANQRTPVSSGTLEKDVRDPVGVEMDAYLRKYWATAPGEAVHREALTSLAGSLEKVVRSEAGPELLKLFAMAHLVALGDKAADLAPKFGVTKDVDRWGRREDLALYAITKGFDKPAYIPAEAEKSAKESSAFGPRYVAALLDIYKVFSANTGYEATWKPLVQLKGAGAPKTATEHMKALADGLRASALCGNCKDGKYTCEVCNGRKRADVKCPTCKGIGWAQKGDEANRLIRCWNCQGAKIFKNHQCVGCKGTGAIECAVCSGKGWREGFKGCKSCKVCASCSGRREITKPCEKCKGKGRTGPEPIPGVPSILCDGCKGAADLKEPCKPCGQSGVGDCEACGGKVGARDGKSAARPKVEDVFTKVACGPCAGKGWPAPGLALPCENCYGLGLTIKPTADPAKTLR